MNRFEITTAAGLVTALALCGCRAPLSVAGGSEPMNEEKKEQRGALCLPFAQRKPVPSPGSECGDGIAGGRCEEIETFSCHESERGKTVHCEQTEICDGNDLRGQTCESVGLSGSGLRCREYCNDVDSSKCDRCPNRPGVKCVEMPLPAKTFAFLTALADSGDVAVLGIPDDGGIVDFHLRSSSGGKRVIRAPKGFDPRYMVALGHDGFVTGGDRDGDSFIVRPLSFASGLGPERRIPVPKDAYRAELARLNGRAVLVARAGSSGNVVQVIPLDDAGGDAPSVPAEKERPPAMHGIDAWSRTPAGWLGHRLGLLVFVDSPAKP